MQNKIVHAAERKAFQTVLNGIVNKGQKKDVAEMADSLVNLMEKILGDSWKQESYDMLRSIATNPDSKWARYANHIIKDMDSKIVSTFLLNAAYEGGFRGYKTAQEAAAENGCNIPWLVLMDPTSACNMRCTGCWAAEYGHKQNLSYEVMDKVLTEGKELGLHACLFTGGEPLMRKKDILRLCEKHKDVAFHAFTNGTLIDDQFCQDLLRVGNFMVSISIEGFEDANDSRRGDGHYQKALAAMDLMRSYRIPFGVSICYTSRNYKDVTSDAFLDMLVEKGCVFAWYFHYMPVGMNASTDLNAAGDVEPCVFIHYSGANVNEMSFLDCLKQPLFMAYHDNQPFNENHLRPCPMLENPEILKRLVKETGAHSTDLEAPESVEHLCGKCELYAEHWAPVAEQVWEGAK